MSKKRKRGLSDLLLALLIIGTVLSLFGGAFWLFELPSHFKPHMALAALILSIHAVFKKHVLFAFAAVVVLCINVVVLLPHFAQSTVPDPTQAVRVLASNINVANKNYNLVRTLVNQLEPDVIGLVETSDDWKRGLEDINSRYNTYYYNDPGVGKFGMAILSRFPITALKVINLSVEGYPSLHATLDVRGEPLEVVVVHPPPPLSTALSEIRNEQFDALAVLARNNERFIAIGDFNSTPWAKNFRRLLSRSGLKLSSSGFAYATTWPTQLGLLGIPIDHILISRNMSVVRHQSARDVGSDHRPIYADIVIGR